MARTTKNKAQTPATVDVFTLARQTLQARQAERTAEATARQAERTAERTKVARVNPFAIPAIGVTSQTVTDAQCMAWLAAVTNGNVPADKAADIAAGFRTLRASLATFNGHVFAPRAERSGRAADVRAMLATF